MYVYMYAFMYLCMYVCMVCIVGGRYILFFLKMVSRLLNEKLNNSFFSAVEKQATSMRNNRSYILSKLRTSFQFGCIHFTFHRSFFQNHLLKT